MSSSRQRKPDLYVSVDVEATGPVPGLFSMSELGAAALNQRRETFYTMLKPLPGAGFDPRAIAIAGPSLEQLERDGRDAHDAIVEFADWIAGLKEPGRRTVMASFGTFDWMWVSWYLHRFVHSNPFGPNGLDIKSFAAGLLGRHYTHAAKRHLPREILGTDQHTHNALDDAMEQGKQLERLLAMAGLSISRMAGHRTQLRPRPSLRL